MNKPLNDVLTRVQGTGFLITCKEFGIREEAAWKISSEITRTIKLFERLNKPCVTEGTENGSN